MFDSVFIIFTNNFALNCESCLNLSQYVDRKARICILVVAVFDLLSMLLPAVFEPPCCYIDLPKEITN